MGDLMDNGRAEMSDNEYEDYVSRFNETFSISPKLPTFYIPGNHDVGLNYPGLYSPDARSRFEHKFGPSNHYTEINGHVFVFIDAPRLVEQEQTRRIKRLSHQKAIQEAGPSETVIGFIDHISRHFGKFEVNTGGRQPDKKIAGDTKPVVLLSHIPLSRPPNANCGPLREKGTIRKGRGVGYQNLLEEDTTEFILGTLAPAIVFSGDDHDYCNYAHIFKAFRGHSKQEYAAREVTIKSFSMAMGIRRPGFQLLSLPSLIAQSQTGMLDRPCNLPDQIGLYTWMYIPAVLICIGIIAWSRMCSPQRNVDFYLEGSWKVPDLTWDHQLDDLKANHLLPTVVTSQDTPRLAKATQASRLSRAVWAILPSRWRIFFLQRYTTSRTSSKSRVTAIFIDVSEVAWPVILTYIVLTLFILW